MTGERLGIPAVGIMTAPFADGARLMAQALGLPGYAFAVVDHPVSSADDAGLAARAMSVLDQAGPLLSRAGGG